MTMTLLDAATYVAHLNYREADASDLKGWLDGSEKGGRIAVVDPDDAERTDGLSYVYIPPSNNQIELFFTNPSDGMMKKVIQFAKYG